MACEVFGVDRSDLVDPWYELRLYAAEPGPVMLASSELIRQWAAT